jgi:hypothetical protein
MNLELDCSLSEYCDEQFIDLRAELLKQVATLPPHGTPASELTDRDKFALAYHAGAPYTTEMVDGRLVFTTAVPVGVADSGDGGYFVAIGS